jgi:hypothetical protein
MSAKPQTMRGQSFYQGILHISNGTMHHQTRNGLRCFDRDLRHATIVYNLHGGLAVMTPGVAALGQQAVERIVQTISVFDDFCHANDPHEEHDFGSFEAEGRTIFFKIDYYDKSMTYHSPDPSDPSVTERVITIMLAEEY